MTESEAGVSFNAVRTADAAALRGHLQHEADVAAQIYSFWEQAATAAPGLLENSQWRADFDKNKNRREAARQRLETLDALLLADAGPEENTLTDTRPVWLLDIDGVLNAVDTEFRLLEQGYSQAVVNGFTIHWRPAVVDFIRTMHESGAVEVRWLTTWCSDAEKVAVALDLPRELTVVGETHWRSLERGWWKLKAAQEVRAAEPDRPIVWTDDDMTAEAGRWARTEVSAGAPSVTPVMPDCRVGLSNDDLARIRAAVRPDAVEETP